MHPRTQELLRHLDDRRQQLRQALDATPPALRERQPAPDRWSAAQVLEHLAIVEERLAAMLGEGLRAAQANGPLPTDPDTRAVLPTIDAGRVLDREQRLAARTPVQPTRGLTADQAWSALQASRQRLRAVVLAADGLATDAVHAPHPYFGELSFHQWIAFVGLHEARHAAQIATTTAALLTG